MVLLGAVAALLLLGIVMVSSASSVLSFQRFGEVYFYFRHQLLLGVLPGVILFLFLIKIDYHFWQRFTIPFLITTIALLVLVFIPGLSETYGRARSWIAIGGLSLQTSELAKLSFILFLAGWFSVRERQLNADFWNGLVPFAAILAVILGLIMFQPDVGTMVVIGAIAMAMYFVAGAKWTHLIGLGVLGLGALGVMISRSSHTVARLMTFLHPEFDPQGIGYHINQAFLAVGSGGLFGLGFGQSQQKFAYLPEVMGDSIFAIIAEEMGFFIAMAIIILFGVIMWRGLQLTRKISDDYARLIVVGIITWLMIQAFFNISAMIGLLPLTGIPLPFISFGGTAMMVSLGAIGILINISKHAD